ncbi:MAG: glycosyltransferase family 2 protein, partial [Nitrospinae bacterium]|nr:glycosyltransferase family 2 protein [Nitrospinota bacterium]
PSFTFIVPALNEAENIPAVLKEIGAVTRESGVSDYEIIVVDDGSSDETANVVVKLASRHTNIALVRNETRRGVGKSFMAGVALGKKEYCLIVPGDNEFALDFFPGAVATLVSGGSDFVVTYVSNPRLRPRHRRIFSFLYITLFNFLFGTDFRYTNGIVIYPTEWIRTVKLISGGYTFQSEALLKAHREGKRLVSTGMTVRPRAHGKSKIFSMRAMMEILASLARMKYADLICRDDS